jgi:hypothetical protein
MNKKGLYAARIEEPRLTMELGSLTRYNRPLVVPQ